MTNSTFVSKREQTYRKNIIIKSNIKFFEKKMHLYSLFFYYRGN